MTTQTVNPMQNITRQILDGMEAVDAWKYAQDCVNYPVEFKDLFWEEPDEVFNVARGVTNTGRDVIYRGVLVDRDRIDKKHVIATVTGLYDTLSVPMVYSSFERELASLNLTNAPCNIYVSGNGGTQELKVRLTDMESPHPDHPIVMILTLQTSLDGTKQHSLNVSAWNEESGFEIVGLSAANYGITAKHTTSIHDRHISMAVVITKLMAEWNETVIPMMRMMLDCEYDAKVASDILETILSDAEFPQMHIKRLVQDAPSDMKNMLDVVTTVSGYMHTEMGDMHDRTLTFKKNLHKSIAKMLKKV